MHEPPSLRQARHHRTARIVVYALFFAVTTAFVVSSTVQIIRAVFYGDAEHDSLLDRRIGGPRLAVFVNTARHSHDSPAAAVLGHSPANHAVARRRG